MTYFEVQNSNGEQIGKTRYFTLAPAQAAAKRIAGKWRKSNEHRGSAVKIVEIESGAIWGGMKTIAWVEAA